MDKYEYRVKTEQMLEYLESKQYKKAMEIADTIDWRRVKSASMLNTVSEIYEYNGEFQKSRDILFVAFDRSPGSRKIVYRLGTLALKINDVEEASDCYEEFVKLAPRDPNQYILKYRILRAQGAPLTEQIAALEDFKKAEYVEKWAYELAEPVTWLASIPFLLSSSLAYAVTRSVAVPSVSVAVAFTYTLPPISTISSDKVSVQPSLASNGFNASKMSSQLLYL